MKYRWLLMVVVLFFNCGDKKTITIGNIPNYENYAIKVNPTVSRPFTFTNNNSAFFYGETGKIRDNGHQGFNVTANKYLDDYYLNVDNKPLKRNEADSIKVYFDNITRFYSNDIIERLTLLDQINCLLLEFQASSKHVFDFMPLITGQDNAEKFLIEWNDKKNLILLAKKIDIDKGDKISYPPFMGIKFSDNTTFNEDNSYAEQQVLQAFRPGRFQCSSNHFFIAIVVGNDKKEVTMLAENVLDTPEYFINQKKARLAALLKNTLLQTNQPDFDKAFQWALVSMDQLIMNQPVQGQPVKGIFAGLPWFNNYWGRDTFISFPGALLVTGRLEEAREILSSFAQFQQKNPEDTNWGRIPNQTTTTGIIYNTSDGTPWFIRELWEYYLYSGDKEFLEQMYPIVERSIEGTLKYHTDAQFFLTHKDAETWMDAKTNKFAWSPRGNRAVEVQALWYEQLLVGIKISGLLGKTEKKINGKKLLKHFRKNLIPAFGTTAGSTYMII